jgi:hypothetical protein
VAYFKVLSQSSGPASKVSFRTGSKSANDCGASFVETVCDLLAEICTPVLLLIQLYRDINIKHT